MARQGRLYPAVILHGADDATRRAVAIDLARTLLCLAPPEERPDGVCRHCRRIGWPGEARSGEAPFHPDFHLLERDLKTSTSVDATRELLRAAQVSPFEARGQVFVIASAESLTGEAANALLKALEEPHLRSPRNFLLLAPSRSDLLPTLRSRSLSLFLGAAEAVDPAAAGPLAGAFAGAVAEYVRSGASVYLLAAAEALFAGVKSRVKAGPGAGAGGGWEDARSGRPWSLAAAAVVAAAAEGLSGMPRRNLLALAEDLLGGPAMRLRGVTPERILEGLVSRHLARPC
ncbi:MAG TPA: hypothetical protein VOA87_02045 [Thermoanaerobaculia bacterium]|nr:hypothetical protein [Thermoanaerobaculia bacterium]